MMIKRLKIVLLLFVVNLVTITAQSNSTEVYLLTCSPGAETYSMYGHSALMLIDNDSGQDIVYNWGVFDFSTPNFNYKFARGRLDYMLGVNSYNNFVRSYFNEERSVYSQRVLLDDDEIVQLKIFLNENMKDENRYYRYDFLKDNCATRIRDIFENILGDRLIYPDIEHEPTSSYRDRLDEYKAGMYWLDAGIDLLIGSPGDDVCDFRGSMFLPDYLMWNLSKASVQRGDDVSGLLEPAVTIFEFDKEPVSKSLLKMPWFILSILALVIFFFTFMVQKRTPQIIFDQLFFIMFFVLAFLMVFTNYLTDHESMGRNFNIIWLNPLLLVAPFVIFSKRNLKMFWSANIALSIIFMILALFIKQAINPAFIPLILILIIRSYYRLSETG